MRAAQRRRRGMTLIETLVVVSLISVMLAVVYPSLNAGLDAVQLSTSADTVASFLNASLTRADRANQVVEVTISKRENALIARSNNVANTRRLDLPANVRITAILPPAGENEELRRFYLQPGGAVPRLGIELKNPRGSRRLIRLDPITGAPEMER
jgi:prepilin-type N-terminal cleavage/methylation domain-containing protein